VLHALYEHRPPLLRILAGACARQSVGPLVSP